MFAPLCTAQTVEKPDLAINKTHAGNFIVGQMGSYTIKVRNVGTGPTNGTPVTVTEQLPAALQAVSIAGDGWNCAQPSGPCVRTDTLGRRAAYPDLIITVTVPPQSPGVVTNTAIVSGGGDTTPDDNSADDPTQIVSGSPDLSVAKSHVGNFIQGQTGTYTIAVSNVGSLATSSSVTVNDLIPAGLVATGMSGTGWNCVQPAGPCSRTDPLPPGTTYPLITVNVNVSANAPAQVTNTAKVAVGGDTNSNNDTANDVTVVVPQGPDLTIIKAHPANFNQYSSGTFTLEVKNIGSQPSSGTVTVAEQPPSGLTITGMNGTNWNCTQPAGPCTRSDVLAPGASYPLITVTATPTVAGNLINTATVSGGGDVNTGNNSGSDPINVAPSTNPCPSLESAHPYAPNTDITLTCTVQGANVGSLNVTFDAQTFVENGPDLIYIMDANGNNIAGSPFTGASLAGQTKVVPGNTVKIRLTSNATNQGYGFKVTNVTTNPISQGPDLTITKSHSGNFLLGQQGVPYTITVKNSGALQTTGQVVVTDTLPSGLTAASASGTGWNCTLPATPADPVTCTRNDALASNGTYPPITLTVNVANNAPASVTNTATVSGGGDVNTSNNTSTDPTTVIAAPVTCTPNGLPESQHPYLNETDQTWTCTVGGNPGSITVSFDALTSFDIFGDLLYIMDKNGNNITGSPFTGTTLSAATVTVPGDTVKLRLVTDVRRTDYGFKVTNISVGGSTPNTPDLTLTKTHTGDFVKGQSGAVYTIVVRNVGTAASNGTVTVTDNLPAGLAAQSISGSGWQCNQPVGPCTRSDSVPAGGSYPPITLTVNVNQDAPSLVTNTVTVSGGGDAFAGNNSYGDSTNIGGIVCTLPESAHPYPNDFDFTWTCTLSGNPSSLAVQFDAQTSFDSTDFLYIMNGNNVNVAGSPFTGTSLAGQTVIVPGNTVKIRLVTDSRRVDYGFRVVSITGQ